MNTRIVVHSGLNRDVAGQPTARDWRFPALCAALLLVGVGCGDDAPTSSIPPTGTAQADPLKRPSAPQQNALIGLTWQQVTVGNGRFTVEMPAAPIPVSRTVDGSHGPIKFLIHKAQIGGVFLNFNLISYPEAAVKANGGGTTFLKKLAAGMLLQKQGSQQEFLNNLEEEGRPAIEHKYRYPAGRTSIGTQYDAGYSIHRMYLVGDQVCWVFADVVGRYAAAEADDVQAEIDRFFGSVTIDD